MFKKSKGRKFRASTKYNAINKQDENEHSEEDILISTNIERIKQNKKFKKHLSQASSKSKVLVSHFKSLDLKKGLENPTKKEMTSKSSKFKQNFKTEDLSDREDPFDPSKRTYNNKELEQIKAENKFKPVEKTINIENKANDKPIESNDDLFKKDYIGFASFQSTNKHTESRIVREEDELSEGETELESKCYVGNNDQAGNIFEQVEVFDEEFLSWEKEQMRKSGVKRSKIKDVNINSAKKNSQVEKIAKPTINFEKINAKLTELKTMNAIDKNNISHRVNSIETKRNLIIEELKNLDKIVDSRIEMIDLLNLKINSYKCL